MMLTILAALLLLLTTALVVAPLFLPVANRPLGRGLETGEPLERWQQEKNRLTGQLRENDLALAEGRIDAATHDRNNRRLAAEAEATLSALRRARDAFGGGADAAVRMPGRVTSAFAALAVVAAAWGVNAVASMNDMDMRVSPHGEGGIPKTDPNSAMMPPAGMPMDADGAPDIGAMVARLEARVKAGDASSEDYRMLLRSYGVLGREAEAPAILKDAADRFPGEIEYRMNYLRMVIETPDAPPAEELLPQVETVLKTVPDLAEAHWYRALLNLDLGRPGAARRDLQWLAVRLTPDHPAAARVRHLLAEVSGTDEPPGEDER